MSKEIRVQIPTWPLGSLGDLWPDAIFYLSGVKIREGVWGECVCHSELLGVRAG